MRRQDSAAWDCTIISGHLRKISLRCCAWPTRRNMNSLVKANPLTDQCNVFPAPQHFLNILPEPQGHNTLRPTVSMLNFPGCDGVRCASQ